MARAALHWKGKLHLSFTRQDKQIEIVIEDNGIGIAESQKAKTVNQQKHSDEV